MRFDAVPIRKFFKTISMTPSVARAKIFAQTCIESRIASTD